MVPHLQVNAERPGPTASPRTANSIQKAGPPGIARDSRFPLFATATTKLDKRILPLRLRRQPGPLPNFVLGRRLLLRGGRSRVQVLVELRQRVRKHNVVRGVVPTLDRDLLPAVLAGEHQARAALRLRDVRLVKPRKEQRQGAILGLDDILAPVRRIVHRHVTSVLAGNRVVPCSAVENIAITRSSKRFGVIRSPEHAAGLQRKGKAHAARAVVRHRVRYTVPGTRRAIEPGLAKVHVLKIDAECRTVRHIQFGGELVRAQLLRLARRDGKAASQILPHGFRKHHARAATCKRQHRANCRRGPGGWRNAVSFAMSAPA